MTTIRLTAAQAARLAAVLPHLQAHRRDGRWAQL